MKPTARLQLIFTAKTEKSKS